MYARVASFESRDTSRVDEIIATVREKIRAGGEIPGARKFLMLLDREGGRSLGITFFDTEDAIRQAEPSFDRMGDEIPEEVRGRRIAVETYEVAIDEIADGARAARLSALEGAPGGIDKGIDFIREEIFPEAGDLTGWRGVLTLVDRTSGRAKTITFWDGPESLRASEERANELRARAAEAMGDTITGVERYEVALYEALVTA
jgi:hypothetical protein